MMPCLHSSQYVILSGQWVKRSGTSFAATLVWKICGASGT